MINREPNILLRLAGTITKQAIKQWNGLLRHKEDEVYSESLLAVTKTLRRYPGLESRMGWSPAMKLYAYGRLIKGLRRSKYLPAEDRQRHSRVKEDVMDDAIEALPADPRPYERQRVAAMLWFGMALADDLSNQIKTQDFHYLDFHDAERLEWVLANDQKTQGMSTLAQDFAMDLPFWLRDLSKRDQQLFVDVTLNKMSGPDAAEKYGISRERVNQIEENAKMILSDVLLWNRKRT